MLGGGGGRTELPLSYHYLITPHTKFFRNKSYDGESLAYTLKAEGLAKDYDGEGARPVW